MGKKRTVHCTPQHDNVASLGNIRRLSETTPTIQPLPTRRNPCYHWLSACITTYGLPVSHQLPAIIWAVQIPEKLIPSSILRASADEPIRVWGVVRTSQMLYVGNTLILCCSQPTKGPPGQSYALGGHGHHNKLVFEAICLLLAMNYLPAKMLKSQPDYTCTDKARRDGDMRHPCPATIIVRIRNTQTTFRV